LRRKSHSTRQRVFTSAIGSIALLAAFACVAVSVAAGSSSSAPRPGTYAGTAGVDLVQLTVPTGGKKISNFTTTFNLAVLCGIPSSTAHESFPAMTIANRHFSGSLAINHGGTVENLAVQGKFVSATKVTGKLSGHFTIKSLPPCHGSSTFSASRKAKK
jgi:hypothetical protein